MKMYRWLKKIGLTHGLVILALAVILGLWINLAEAKLTTTENLIKNPGAETGTQSWTGLEGMTFLAVSGVVDGNNNTILSPKGGSAFFYLKKDADDVYAYQWIDVSSCAEGIDTGSATANLKGYTASDVNDSIRIRLKFTDKKDGTTTQECDTGLDAFDNYTWKEKKLSDIVVPKFTRWICILIEAHRGGGTWNQGYFDDLNLTLTVPGASTIGGDFNFGDLYANTNISAANFNKLIKRTLTIDNASEKTMPWNINTSCNWIKFSRSKGDLDVNNTENVDVWLEPSSDLTTGLQHATFTVICGSKTQTVTADVGLYPRMKVERVSPAGETVHVGLKRSIEFKVQQSGVPYHHDAKFGDGYLWKKSGKLNSDEQYNLDTNAFDNTSDPQKEYTFSDSGYVYVYAAAKEAVTKDNVTRTIVGDILEIPVRVWKLPTVNESPVQTSSWYGNDKKYVGEVGKPIQLKASGSTQNSDSSESIEKFIWDFDDNWDTIEAIQTGDNEVSYTPSTPNLLGRVSCKAVTNYGIVGEAKTFNVKVYEPVQVDVQGPYTGRPNKPVEMQCSVNKMSYAGLTNVTYEWTVSGYSSNQTTGDDLNKGKAKYTWSSNGDYSVSVTVKVTTREGLVITGAGSTIVKIDASIPTAMPGGPYRGGIKGGNFSPIQFEGNPIDFIEAEEVGRLSAWSWSFGDGEAANIWNPTHSFAKAGNYKASLKVRSAFGKESPVTQADVEVIDGKIAGYVRAADLRTPIASVTLTLDSSHVDKEVLKQIANGSETDRLYANPDGTIWTLTDNKGYYEFDHIPLGNYRVLARKGSGDEAHEFKSPLVTTDLDLQGSKQLAIDFVDLTVFPVGGRITYSLQKNGQDVLVEDVLVTAYPAGATGFSQANPSQKSLSATGVNYSLPLLGGKYLFTAEKQGQDIRIKEGTPDYSAITDLVTINNAKTNLDFINHTTYKLSVFVKDSGGYKMSGYQVVISGDNGQAEGKSDESDGKVRVALNPGIYTVRVPGADPEEKEVDLRYGDNSVEMIIPVKIELSIGPMPRIIDPAIFDFLKEAGLTEKDNPEGYMIYLPPPASIGHTFTVIPTANGKAVNGFTLFIRDEVGMLTPDPADDKKIIVNGKEGKYCMIAGLPKTTLDDPPLAAPKRITFWAKKDGYRDSDKVTLEVTVLGDVAKGAVAKIVSLPTINYLVLHDPPGDGSFSYLDDSLTVNSVVYYKGMEMGRDRKPVPVYPELWSNERWIKDTKFEGSKEDLQDLENKGILSGKQTGVGVGWGFAVDALLEYGLGAIPCITYKVMDKIIKKMKAKAVLTAAATALAGGAGGLALDAAAEATEAVSTGVQIATTLLQLGLWSGKAATIDQCGWIQYDVTPNRHLETPSGDERPELLGPGRGDVYFGEGLTMGLQTKYRLGIEPTSSGEWKLITKEIMTYTILDRKNQYIYTAADIENVINDLQKEIDKVTAAKQKLGTQTPEYKKEDDKQKDLEKVTERWQDLLDKNLAYKWQEALSGTQSKSFDDFLNKEGKALQKASGQTLIFNGGPTFDYSRTISESDTVGYSTEVGQETAFLKLEGGDELWFKNEVCLKSGVSLSKEVESGQSTEQTVGFVLKDDDVGDYYSCRIYEDPVWGTPIFFQESGCSSDPWENGTNKAVDVTMELVKEPARTIPFDYQSGAQYKLMIVNRGERQYGTDFVLRADVTRGPETYGSATISHPTVKFNGQSGPYVVGLSKDSPIAMVNLSIYAPEIDCDNSQNKEYEVTIVAEEEADDQISRQLTLRPEFADLRAPRAVITAPYAGERVSPVFFRQDNPFDVKVVSSDMDIGSIQLQIRSKQPDGVWEPWRNLSGMKWDGTISTMGTTAAIGSGSNVSVFCRLDRVPPRIEYTFQWTEAEIKALGVGEYAIRAVAKDHATKPNVDIDPPDVVFLVDESKPSVLTSIPNYQDSDSKRIYQGELSVLFTDDMRAMDFTDRTFVVVDLLDNNKQVAGYVSYSPALRKATFVPVVPFKPYGYYRVEIKTDEEKNGKIERGVHDLAGNPLDNAFMWTFRTTEAPFEETWGITLSATDGRNTDGNNIAAVAYGALDSEDEKDARAVPSMANQLRLSFLNRENVEFDRDVRPADGRLSHHWFFVIDNARSGSEITIKWQPSMKLTKSTRHYQNIRLVEFDAQGNVTNTKNLNPAKAEMDDKTGEIIPMIAYTYTNKGEASRYFRLDVEKIGFVAKTLKKGSSGWKFFSVPIMPQVADPYVNLGDDIEPFRLYQYETELAGYRIYPYDLGYIALQPGHGYFTQLSRDTDVDVGGARNYDPITLSLNDAGWHAIGNPFISPVNVADLQVQAGSSSVVSFAQAVANALVEGTLYRWNSEASQPDSYEAVSIKGQIRSWDGCWLRTRQSGLTLTIPVPAGEKNAVPEIPAYLKLPMASPSKDMTVQEDAAEQFRLWFNLSSPAASDKTTALGTHRDAREGADALDSMEPPLMENTVSAYFNHADGDKDSGQYNYDYQPFMQPGDSHTWELVVHTDQPHTPMTLSWGEAIGQVPGDIMLSFRQLGDSGSLAPSVNQWQDMRQVQQVEFTSGARITNLRFEIRAERLGVTSPTGVKAVVNNRQQVVIAWKIEDTSQVKGYYITRWDKHGNRKQYELNESSASQFVDTDTTEGNTYTYEVSALTMEGIELRGQQATVEISGSSPGTTEMFPCYPNPTTSGVYFPYQLSSPAEVEVKIYTIAGEEVWSTDPGMQAEGQHTIYWNGCNQSGDRAGSGIYIYLFRAGSYTARGKIGVCR